MAILLDARGNEFFGQLDNITGQVLVDARSPSTVLGAANAEALVDLNGHATMMIDLRTAAGSLTLVFEATIDGTNYFALPAYNLATGAYVISVVSTTTQNTQLALNVAGFRRMRVRCSAYTSGNMTVSLRATTSDFTQIVERIPATSGLTVTAAAGSAATLTIPAPGVGLFQYVDWIRIQHFAAALLTAGAVPTIVTTTNIPGTPSFNFRADATPQGTLSEVVVSNGMPIRGITTNTAITIVCPATTNVLWKVCASWRIGA